MSVLTVIFLPYWIAFKITFGEKIMKLPGSQMISIPSYLCCQILFCSICLMIASSSSVYIEIIYCSSVDDCLTSVVQHNQSCLVMKSF